MYNFANYTNGGFYIKALFSWVVSFFVLSLLTKLICTGGSYINKLLNFADPRVLVIIAAKIWTMNRFTISQVLEKNLRPLLLIVIDSGVLHSLALLALLITYVSNSWTWYLLMDVVSHFSYHLHKF